MQLTQKLEDQDIKLRQLIYGKQKTKKTWYAAKAAESNFNVILFDGDDGWHILNNIKHEYQKRITVVDCVDTTDRAIFATFLSRLLKKGKINWDEVEKKVALKPNENTLAIDLTKLTKNDVVIIDSWTALVWSLTYKYALENHIDMADAEKDEWEFYRWGGRIATWIANQLQSLPCHVIVVAHETEYQKMKRNSQGKEVVDYVRVQIKSVSGNHASTMGTFFSDVLHFKQQSETVFKIEAFGNACEEGGSRLIEPKSYNWDEFSFGDFCKQAGVAIPDENNPLLNFSQGGMNEVAENKPIETSETKTVKVGGLGLNLKK